EAGERQLNENVVDLRDVTGACLDLLQGKIQDGAITVTNDLQNVPEIVGEELAIKQIFMNVLSNAVKFTPQGGRVTVSSELDRQGRLLVSVTDTGIGLDAHEIDKALSPFGQVNSELSRSGSGTGLGLTLVDALLKLHGGELELLSQKGIGTTVTVIFPANRVMKRDGAAQGGVSGFDVSQQMDETF
ncbi:MAG: sensor histidine kinase, partial [Bdellovibrionales bacterium]